MLTTITKSVEFQGIDILLRWDDQGFWVDSYGTRWPDIWDDAGYCGIAPAETGKWDPFWQKACVNHDRDFNALKAGYKDGDALKTFGNFTGSVLSTMAGGAYAVVMGIPYIIVGGIGGLLRWAQISSRE